jgi:excinuclease UvrABC nuclease subunit
MDFPDPSKGETLTAPIGPGVYRLRNRKIREWVLFGKSKSVCYRMASLLPKGPGTRKNLKKRNYVKKHLKDIEYQTMSFPTEKEAKSEEKTLRDKYNWIFPK